MKKGENLLEFVDIRVDLGGEFFYDFINIKFYKFLKNFPHSLNKN